MKIKYRHKGLTITDGLHFEKFCEVEVSEELGKELLKQPNLFIEIKEDKVKETKQIEKQETKIEEPKKETPKPKTTRKRTPRTKAKTEAK